ncbi:GNAT family N-acetyltransferase [Sinomicrobium weinanense]|uniref:GNAT family N-acetyltransferase n=1 Tax=Sinomicrobium weinanense TaxID=2842200 RepID=A0A926JW31_9FLAO|nr:GNAT family N-acetyltransferase [Sinomicrobium weinanense]MBC9798252.1 GNAT family N-acetyltransferase [Sinomicrobium weinanense]MBU3122643.1 GNAT family N-acetyltransferase [Sinomicrobium weinanense]
MEFIEKRALSEKQKQQILDLWNREYPNALSLPDIRSFEKYLRSLADKHHLLLLDDEKNIKGWLVYFIRDGAQCFAMLLNPDQQGKGLGSRLLTLAKERTAELHGWVIDNDNEPKHNGEKYRSPIGFYEKNGFDILHDHREVKNGIKGIRVSWKSP